MTMAMVLLTLGMAARVHALDADEFEARVQAAAAGDRDVALRRLDALAAEAMQAGRLDLRLLSIAMHARLRIKSGDFGRVRQDLEEARSEARNGSWLAAEAWVDDVFGEFWLAQGDPVAAAEWLELAWGAALAAGPAEHGFASSVLGRLEQVRRGLGQDHLAAQASAWRALLAAEPGAPAPSVVLQPASLSTQVAVDEVGRARLFLANASATPVTGTLLVDGGDLTIRDWETTSSAENVALQFPAASGVVPHSPTQGRKITLLPRESRTIIVEVEPNAPPRLADKTVTLSWQTAAATATATARFFFRKSRDLPATSVANSCLVQLSPLVSVPVCMEIYHRSGNKNHLQDVWPVTSHPCRVELYEILPDGRSGRQWLAIDADGDGVPRGAADAVVADADGSQFPDVEFTAQKPVVALEVRLYPLPNPDGSLPASLDLEVSLRDGARWRAPADVRHRVESPK